MKNYFRLNILVLTLALPLLLGSCSSEDNLPDVRLSISESGGVQRDGCLYVKNGDSININNISIIADESTPKSMITTCDYYWDGFYVGPAFAPDFNRAFVVYNQPLGKHYLTIRSLVAAEGYSLATYVTQIPVIVVNEDQMPEPDDTDLFRHAEASRYAGNQDIGTN